MSARIDAIRAEEMATGKLEWWYLSFAEPGKFKGAVYVRAFGLIDATHQAHLRKINPCGQVLGAVVPAEHVPPPSYRNRLLSVDDLREVMGDDMTTLGDLTRKTRTRL